VSMTIGRLQAREVPGLQQLRSESVQEYSLNHLWSSGKIGDKCYKHYRTMLYFLLQT